MDNLKNESARGADAHGASAAAIPENESERLAALRSYEILDTPSEEAFDDITLLASAICQTPIALVSLVDSDRQWFKSKVGIDAPETPRDWAFCAHAILQSDLLQVPDAAADPRFKSNPLVVSDPKIRFYAGAPLITGDRIHLGTLCVIDRSARKLTAEQEKSLRVLSRQVVAQLELRRALKRQKRLEQILREGNLLQSAILNSANYSIISTDTDGTIRTFNQTAERWLGYSAEELVGKQTPALFHDPGEVSDRAKTLSAEIGSVVEPGFDVFVAKARLREPDENEWTYIRRDGHRFPVLLSVTALLADDGQQVGFLGVASDITDRKQAEIELREARREAEQATRLKSEFLANMSHEIRTPINGVLGITDLLLDTDLDPTQLDYATTILASAQALQTVINDILDFSKIEAGKLEFEIADFDLGEVVETSVRLLAESAMAKRIELVANVDPGVPAGLRGDSGRLKQVLVNLLNNAVKFTDTGEVVLRVTKDSETPAETVVRFEVTDTGVGIPDAARARLFEKFSQADASTARKHGGTGLGLAISRQLVELMRGKIGVESEVGKGSKFWFQARFEKQSPGEKTGPCLSEKLDRLRILIVDDNKANRQMLEQQFGSWNLRADSVGDSKEAMRALQRAAADGKPFEIALVDQQMPDLDGLALAREIKLDSRLSRTRIILMVPIGYAQADVVPSSPDSFETISKPLLKSKLFDLLMNVVGNENDSPAAGVRSSESREDAPTKNTPAPASGPRILLAEDNVINRKVALGQLNRVGYTADCCVNGLEAIEAFRNVPYDIILALRVLEWVNWGHFWARERVKTS
ncbi:MAG: ATP-binding protein, partial [Verrucomicrobia bacterium]|nr:ATP-binding protein [Verrucomicrobiota bacterium]